MFKNVGWTIKNIAVFSLVFGIIAALIVGIIVLSDEEPWIRITVVFGGSFEVWVTSVLIYGFGQIVENTDKLVAEKYKSSADDNEEAESMGSKESNDEKSF